VVQAERLHFYSLCDPINFMEMEDVMSRKRIALILAWVLPWSSWLQLHAVKRQHNAAQLQPLFLEATLGFVSSVNAVTL